MPLPLLDHSALALFAQRTRIPTSARSSSIGFCAIWVCISSSSLAASELLKSKEAPDSVFPKGSLTRAQVGRGANGVRAGNKLEGRIRLSDTRA
jgi:hypothetical protein